MRVKAGLTNTMGFPGRFGSVISTPVVVEDTAAARPLLRWANSANWRSRALASLMSE